MREKRGGMTCSKYLKGLKGGCNALFTADVLTSHSRKSTGVTYNTDDRSVPAKCSNKQSQ